MTELEHPNPPQHEGWQSCFKADITPQLPSLDPYHKGANKLKGKAVIITGGDSGIGRVVAAVFAKEGADISIIYMNEHENAQETQRIVNAFGRKCLLIPGNIGNEAFCKEAVLETVTTLGRIDCVINNAAEQHPQESVLDITAEQLEKTFRTNIFAMFYLTQAALPYLKAGSSIINTASVTAYKGNPKLLDYSATEGAIISFTRSLSLALAESKIRVNAVAAGSGWASSICAEHDVDTSGENAPVQRINQPDEVAKCFIFLASTDASYLSGQVIHPGGGTIIS